MEDNLEYSNKKKNNKGKSSKEIVGDHGEKDEEEEKRGWCRR